MNRTQVLALLSLFVGLAHSFSWDIVVGEEKRLKFYYNGTLEHTEHIPAANDITSIAYDPVYDRVLFADYHDMNTSISSFDISTRQIQPLVSRITDYNIDNLAYDPVTQLLFWNVGDWLYSVIYSFSLKLALSNKALVRKFVVDFHDKCGAIAVDSCGGFIYWATISKIERVAFDGSYREVLIQSSGEGPGVVARRGLAIDQKTQTMYWTEEMTLNEYTIGSADLNGKNRRTFYFLGTDIGATDLTVTKHFIFWKSYDQRAILRLPKNQQYSVEPTVFSNSSRHFWSHKLIAAKYIGKEQTLGIKSCETLKSLILDMEERYCHNYCFQGNCSVSAERQPKCSCNRGYSGERCELDACFKHCFNDGVCSLNEAEKPVCQCTADYQGERCDVSICKDYCLQGNCSISTEGQPTCRCNAGYSGERCEVKACLNYCSNNGVCSLNEEHQPVCQCTAGYEGERCDVATTHTGACVCADKTTQQMLLDLRSEVKQVGEYVPCTNQNTNLRGVNE